MYHADLPVRGSDPVLNGSAGFFLPTPNPEPDRRSGSAPTPNPERNHGPVREGSGLDQSSEPNRGNPTQLSSQSHCFRRTGTSQLKYRYHMGMQVPARTICGVTNWMDSKSWEISCPCPRPAHRRIWDSDANDRKSMFFPRPKGMFQEKLTGHSHNFHYGV